MTVSAIRFDLAAIYLAVALVIALAVFILVRFIVRSIRSLGGKGGASCHGSSPDTCASGSCAGCSLSGSCDVAHAGNKERKNGRPT
jgi:hypothetical protein